MILTCLFLVLPIDAQQILPSTGVVNPLTSYTAVRRLDGAFFVFDQFDHTILLFESPDTKPRIVAKRGLGPGELDRTNRIQLFGEKLYVFSAAHIQIFDAQGTYLERLRLLPGLKIFKTIDGWAGKKWALRHENREILLFDETLLGQKEVVTWQEEIPTAIKVKSRNLEVPIFQELGDFCVSHDGLRLFYRLPHRPKIVIFDLVRKEVAGSIMLEKRFPFDERLGKSEVETLSSELQGVKVTGKFPDYFPYSSGLYADLDGGLVVRRLAGNGEHLLRFDSEGQPLKPSDLTLEQMQRVIADEGDFVFVSFTHPEQGDQGIAKVAKGDEKDFLNQFE